MQLHDLSYLPRSLASAKFQKWMHAESASIHFWLHAAFSGCMHSVPLMSISR